jgi:hypothetical protein
VQHLEAFAAALADRYAIGNELGRGGMAVVYRAHDLRHDRPVALKAIQPQGADRDAGARFQREVRLTARLQHPNILPLHDSGEAAGILWYAAPLVAGGSVRDRLNRETRLPVAEAVRLTRQVGAALQHAHAQGVVHRDIKPENVLLTPEGDALVADFGIATAVSAGAEPRLTATGMSLGTPAYMSPEQLGGERVDARTDVYALGCLLHELLAGEPPHSAATPMAMLTRRMTEAPPSIGRIRPEVPAALDATLVRALAPNPADRTPSVAAFLADLDAAASGAAIGAPGGAGRAGRSWRRTAAWVGALAVVGVGAALLLARDRPGAPTPAAEIDPEVRDLFARGRQSLGRRSAASTAEAVALLGEVVARDSGFAAGWAELSRAYSLAYRWKYPLPGLTQDSVLRLILWTSDRATVEDSTDPDGWLARAAAARIVYPDVAAPQLHAARRALALDSSRSEAWVVVAGGLLLAGDTAAAGEHFRRAVETAPGDPAPLAFLAFFHHYLGQDDRAAAWADSALVLGPTLLDGHRAAGVAHLGLGDAGRARREFEAAARIAVGPDRTVDLAGQAIAAAKLDDRRAAAQLADSAAGLADTLAPAPVEAVFLGAMWIELGDLDRGLALLERVEPRGDLQFQLHLATEPGFARVRGLPRFRALRTTPPPRGPAPP